MNRNGRKLQWDWYDGVIPDNVLVYEDAYVETAHCFEFYRSTLPEGVSLGTAASVYLGTMFDVGPCGRVSIGNYSLIKSAWFICDSTIEIGDYALISWNVVFMDNYRVSRDSPTRRERLRVFANTDSRRICDRLDPRPISVGRNVWIGFDCSILPGVTIGESSIVGARSVVTENVPPFTIAAGNPARVIREIEPYEHNPTT